MTLSPTVPLDDSTLELILSAISDEAGLNDDLSRDPGQFSLPRLLEFLADDADTEGLEPVAHGHWRGELTPIYDRALPADRQSLDVWDVIRALIAEVRRLRVAMGVQQRRCETCAAPVTKADTVWEWRYCSACFPF